MSIRDPQSFFRLSLAIVFCTVILLPGMLMVFGEKQLYSQTEKRMLEEFPASPGSFSEVSEFLININAYLNDHFGLREFFVHRYQREVRKRFDVIGDDVDVLKGLENYYYYTRYNMLEDFMGRQELSRNEVQQWVEHFEEKERWLSERGIPYLLVATPSKYSIYPEHVSKDWEAIRGENRLQQLEKYLVKGGGPAFIDLSGRLLKEKNSEYLFHKSDTHWTPYGAYLGYLGIAGEVEKILPALSFKKNFSFSRELNRDCAPKGNKCGDLTQMLLDFEPFKEPYRVVDNYSICSKRQTLSLPLSKLDPNPEPLNIETICPEKHSTAVVFHDSFFVSIRPFFSENFGRVVYLWKNYDQANIEEIMNFFKPDIVVEERAERRLFEGLPD